MIRTKRKKIIKHIISIFILLFSLPVFITCRASRAPASETTEPQEPVLPVIQILSEPDFDLTMYDTVILNARLINPETNSDLDNYNIGILGGRIAALTRRPLQGVNVVDATGLVAAPGFIDILSFELSYTSERFKIADGITTALAMHGGTANAKLWYELRASRPDMINYGASSFITVMRQNAGYGDRTPMTNPAHIETHVNNVRRNILDGALGISMSPEYVPGVQWDEMLALCYLAAEMNVATYHHVRYATPHGENNSLAAIQEVIDLSRQTGAAAHIMHINSTGATHVAVEAFAMISEAIARGMDITACTYPYDFWASYINSARFDPGWQQRFNLTYNDLHIPNGTTRLTADLFRTYRLQRVLVLARDSIPEHEVRLALQQPFIFIGSDDVMMADGLSHPRGAGLASRTIGKYAREEGVISLMEAVSKLTILPARRIESASDDIKRKGRLEIGADADIVLFDYETIIDRATPERPATFSAGIEYVWVNGQLCLNPRGILGVRAGKPIMSRYASPAQPLVYTEYLIFAGDAGIQDTAKGIIQAYELFNLPFADLRTAAELLQQDYTLAENGSITFGQAKLMLGETQFASYGQESHLHHEPVIFRGSVYVPVYDLPGLLYGLTIQVY